MRQAVLDGFLDWTAKFESYVTYLYLDVVGLVTIGYGNLVDPVETVQGLVFVHPDGSPATQAEVNQAWHTVKAQQASAKQGGAHFAQFTRIRATEASIRKVCTDKLGQIDHDVRAWFPVWDTFPAKVQLGIASMCWAMGAAKLSAFPHFRSTINSGKWADVAVPHDNPNSCRMSEVNENPSFHARNEANVALFLAAGQPGDDPDSLT